MVWRVLNRFRRGGDPVALAGLAIAAAATGFAFTVGWMALWQRRPALPQVWLAFNLGPGLAPAWQLLLLGMTVALLAARFGVARVGGRPAAARPLAPVNVPAG